MSEYLIQVDNYTHKYNLQFPIILSQTGISQEEWRETIERASEIYSKFMGSIRFRNRLFIIGFILYTFIMIFAIFLLGIPFILFMVFLLPIITYDSTLMIVSIILPTCLMIVVPLLGFMIAFSLVFFKKIFFFFIFFKIIFLNNLIFFKIQNNFLILILILIII